MSSTEVLGSFTERLLDQQANAQPMDISYSRPSSAGEQVRRLFEGYLFVESSAILTRCSRCKCKYLVVLEELNAHFFDSLY